MSKSFQNRPTWAEINLNSLTYNFRSAKEFIGRHISYMAVVKADAYGHNSVECAKRLQIEGIDWFGVALPEEAILLRQANISKSILCLGGFWSGQEEMIIQNEITPVVYQIEKAEKLNIISQNRQIVTPVHIKIDSGMGRIGVRSDAVKDFAEKLRKFGNLRVEGLMSHLAVADDPCENDFTDLQINRFLQAVEVFRENGFHPEYIDIANSPGAIAHRNSRGNLVRLGGILYGLHADVLPKYHEKPDLQPVMSLHTRVSHLKTVPKGETVGYGRTFTTGRESLIATIPIGYQDGLPRLLSNRGKVIVKDRFAPIVGRISMDWTILDVTDIPNVKLDDIVTIIGKQGDLLITAEELAGQAETISYEITCGINQRVIRKYVGNEEKQDF